MNLFILLFNALTYWVTYVFDCLSIYLFIYLFIFLFIHLCMHLFMNIFLYAFLYFFICSLIHSLFIVYLFVYLIILHFVVLFDACNFFSSVCWFVFSNVFFSGRNHFVCLFVYLYGFIFYAFLCCRCFLLLEYHHLLHLSVSFFFFFLL